MTNEAAFSAIVMKHPVTRGHVPVRMESAQSVPTLFTVLYSLFTATHEARQGCCALQSFTVPALQKLFRLLRTAFAGQNGKKYVDSLLTSAKSCVTI